jgi:riboflavin kinase/FMN adenylyltransferase
LIEDKNKIIPKNGVYAVNVFHNNTLYKGVMNIGNNPTVSSENKNSLEVYIFDFNKDIYGEHITIEFIERIREEQKFNSIKDLKSQIEKDKKNALNLLS